MIAPPSVVKRRGAVPLLFSADGGGAAGKSGDSGGSGRMQQKSRHPLIVDQTADLETWTVYPTPGFCIKFKEPQYCNSATLIGAEKLPDKFFINLAHCIELPPPSADVDEDEAAKLIDQEEGETEEGGEGKSGGFKVPISLGELQWAEDKQGGVVHKVDCLVNSNFFQKRLEMSEFFRQFTLKIIIGAIAVRYGIQLDPRRQIFLRNKRHIGELEPQRIRKRPAESFLPATPQASNSKREETKEEEQHSKCSSISQPNNKGESAVVAVKEEKVVVDVSDEDVDAIEDEGERRRPRPFKVQIVDAGEMAEIRVRVREQQTKSDSGDGVSGGSGELVRDGKRLTLKLNDDRCVVLLDGERTVADFYLPLALVPERAEAAFDSETGTLEIRCPVDWGTK